MPASRSRLGVIFLTVLIDLIGFGIIMPILPLYAQRFGAQGIGYGALVFVFSAMQFVATALLGRLSDRIGRRPILLTTMLFNAAGYVLFALAPSYALLFLARVISGFASGNISAAQAYVADITSPAERARGMGTIGAAFGIGFVLGPMIGGLADHYLGHLAPGLIAAGLSLVNFGSASVILRESLAAEHRRERPLFDFGHMGEALRRERLRPLMLVWFLAPFSFAGYTVALPLHATRAFGWGAKELGWLFVVIGMIAAAVQGFLFGRLERHTGARAWRPPAVRPHGAARLREQSVRAGGVGTRLHLCRPHGARHHSRRRAGVRRARPEPGPSRRGMDVRRARADGDVSGGGRDNAGGWSEQYAVVQARQRLDAQTRSGEQFEETGVPRTCRLFSPVRLRV